MSSDMACRYRQSHHVIVLIDKQIALHRAATNDVKNNCITKYRAGSLVGNRY